MKKLMALVLVMVIVVCCVSFASAADRVGADADMIKSAQEEGSLVVYGSCDEPYLIAACLKFEELYGIHVEYQRLSTAKVQMMLTEENGNPSGDVWFGGTNEPYNEAAKAGLLEAYNAKNAIHIVKDEFKDPDGYWYGIYQGILGFMVNTYELSDKNLEAPKTWDDLLKPEYKGLIWMSNPDTAGTARLVINTIIQMKGHDEGIAYLVNLDKNIAKYTQSGAGPSKSVGSGECVIAIGFLHDGLAQYLSAYDSIKLIIPDDGTSYEIGSTAIFKGCAHPNAAKLWIEFALSPECVELADDTGGYQYLVLDNAEDPSALAVFPELNRNNTIEYNFTDAKENTTKYVDDYFNALREAGVDKDTDDRFEKE